MQPNPPAHSVYLSVHSWRAEACCEQRVTWHTWSLCFVYSSSSMSTSLCFLSPPALSLRPCRLKKKKKISREQTVNVMSLLSSPAYMLTLPSTSCLVVGLVVPLVPPLCDVIFVKRVFWSQEKRGSKNGKVCLNAWFSLIPLTEVPPTLLQSQRILECAQVLRRTVTFVWLAGSLIPQN